MILNCLKNSSESIWFYYICAAYSTKFPFSFESASQKLFDSICWRKSNGNKEGKPFSIAEAQTISRSTNNKPELELGIYTFSRSMRKWFSLSGWFILRKCFLLSNEWVRQKSFHYTSTVRTIFLMDFIIYVLFQINANFPLLFA